MPRGGKQPGAGRPKGSKEGHTLKAEELRKYFVAQVTKHADELLPPLLDSAKGIFIGKKKLETGEIISVYQEKPDVNAAKYLFDQGIGRPRETIELAGEVNLRINA